MLVACPRPLVSIEKGRGSSPLQTLRQPQRRAGDEEVVYEYRDVTDCDAVTGQVKISGVVDVGFGEVIDQVDAGEANEFLHISV